MKKRTIKQFYSEYRKAIRKKILIKGICEVCGSTKRIHGHHPTYSDPLKVIWVCPKHHKEIHMSKETQMRSQFVRIRNKKYGRFLNEIEKLLNNKIISIKTVIEIYKEINREIKRILIYENFIKN